MEMIDTASWVVPWKSFLESGALFAETQISDSPRQKIWVAWDLISKAEEPHPEYYSLWVPDFFLENKTSWYHWGQCLEIDTAEFLAELKRYSSTFLTPKAENQTPPAIQWSELVQSSFLEDFRNSMELLKSGAITKIVPLVMRQGRVAAPVHEMVHEMLPVILHLLKRVLAPPVVSGHPYGFWHKGAGILGVTPELLCEVHKERFLKTMALAGTLPTCNSDELLNNPKIRKEQAIVVESLIGTLRKLGSVNQGPTYTVKYLSLSHLQTDIYLESRTPLSVKEVIDLLHPTPALGGFPKQTSLAALKTFSVDSAKRQRFGAPFVLRKPSGDFSALVAIRNLQWQNFEFFLGAGCGLIHDSVASDEWQEVLLKQQAVRELMGL